MYVKGVSLTCQCDGHLRWQRLGTHLGGSSRTYSGATYQACLDQAKADGWVFTWERCYCWLCAPQLSVQSLNHSPAPN